MELSKKGIVSEGQRTQNGRSSIRNEDQFYLEFCQNTSRFGKRETEKNFQCRERCFYKLYNREQEI